MTPHVAPDDSPRPYGPIGLVLSLPPIAVVTILLSLLEAGVVFGATAAVLGWQGAVAKASALQQSMTSDAQVLEHVGIVASLGIYAAASGAILLAARFRAGRGWRVPIGWALWHPFRGSRAFWAIAVATIAYSLGADLLVSYAYPPSQDWIKLPAGALWVGLFVLLAVVFAPVTEELVFRGWLYTSLRTTPLGRWGANLLTSALFALAHWERTHIYALVVFPVGVALALVRERTGSLKASMTFHALFNGAASLLLAGGF